MVNKLYSLGFIFLSHLWSYVCSVFKNNFYHFQSQHQTRNRTNSAWFYSWQNLQPKEKAPNKLHTAAEMKDALEENAVQTADSKRGPERQNTNYSDIKA